MKITEILNIKFNYQMTESLLALLFDEEKRNAAFEQYLATNPDLSQDCFLAEFQAQFADRSGLKQDYTPSSICRILADISGKAESVLDVCSGTGALTLAKWAQCKTAKFYCEEYSKEAVAILLFNLALRGINAEVRHGDVLTGETFAGYRLTKQGKFSHIEQVALDWSDLKVDCVISNPPYSLGWQPKEDERFQGYALAPKSKADYAFVLHGLHYLKPNGTASFILPHGVLFRGQGEGKIRRQLIEEQRLNSVIGLPEKLFLATSIPTCILTFKPDSQNVWICDASELREPQPKINIMNDSHIKAIIDAYRQRQTVERLANVVSLAELKENDFNLNIPRYVDKFVAEDVPDLLETARELLQLTKEADEAGRQFVAMMNELQMPNGSAREQAEFAEAKRIMQQVFAPRDYETSFIEKISTVDYLPLFTTEEIEKIQGFIEMTEKKIEQLKAVKNYFTSKMFV